MLDVFYCDFLYCDVEEIIRNVIDPFKKIFQPSMQVTVTNFEKKDGDETNGSRKYCEEGKGTTF